MQVAEGIELSDASWQRSAMKVTISPLAPAARMDYGRYENIKLIWNKVDTECGVSLQLLTSADGDQQFYCILNYFLFSTVALILHVHFQ